jgi:hypothetical protein
MEGGGGNKVNNRDRARGRQMESETGETRGQVNRADWGTVYEDRARGRKMESETEDTRGQANRADWGTVYWQRN